MTSKYSGLSNELYNYIISFKETVKKEFGFNSDYIFYNYKTNNLYTRQWLHKRFRLLSETLGFEDAGIQSIRKASAIKVLNSTGSLSIAQYHLTHKRATTTDKYLGVSQASSLEQLSKVF